MRPVFFVKEEEADLARQIESRLLALPIDSGVLFAGVSVAPEEYNISTGERLPAVYRVWIGCHRSFDPRLMDAVVKHVLREEIAGGLRVEVQAYCGLGRSFIQNR